jgi:hypothetical protein
MKADRYWKRLLIGPLLVMKLVFVALVACYSLNNKLVENFAR